MSVCSSLYSFSMRSRSRAAMRRSCMSRIALAWASSRLYHCIRLVRAASESSAPRISAMMASRLASATRRPSRMWALPLAFLSSKRERRVMTSRLNLMNSSSAIATETTLGVPSTMASILAEKELCIAVNLYRLLRITRLCAPDRNSITMRMPFRSDSSRSSDIPSSRLVLTRLAIFSIRVALLTWYGNSVTTICILLDRFISSIPATARTIIWPLPVSYALRMPSVPMMVPPVGKSGPVMRFMSWSTVASGFLRSR